MVADVAREALADFIGTAMRAQMERTPPWRGEVLFSFWW
jgi:hypothetical protein